MDHNGACACGSGMEIGRVTDQPGPKLLVRHRVGPVWRVLAGILALLFAGGFAFALMSGGFPRRDRDMVVILPALALLFGYVARTARAPGWLATMQGEPANDD